MEDIIIGGHSVSALKEIKKAIQQDAVKVISDNTDAALAKFSALKDAETKEQAHTLAQEIYEHLEIVEVVAGVSGCVHYLPYYEEYGRHESEDVISRYLEDNENEALEYDWRDKNDPLYKLAQLAGSLESDSMDWHSSMC